MPAVAPSRQPGASNRFSGKEAQWLLAGERRWLAGQLATRPARSWLWLAPTERPQTDVPAPRGLWLCEHAGGYGGTVRCGLPLPVPNDCLGDVVLQHPEVRDAGPLLAECSRVLVDGGRLWLFLGNPWSPYRFRRRVGLPVSAAAPWQLRLRGQGLRVEPPRFIGPCWRVLPPEGDETGAWEGDGRVGPVLRACCVVVAEKRVAPLTPTPVAWRHGAAPAA